jgi:hypothetical protein
MKKLILAIMFVLPLAAQTTPVAVTLTVANADIADFNTWATRQYWSPGSFPAIEAPVTAGDNSIAVSSTTGWPSTGALLIDNEAVTYSGTDSTHFTGLARAQFGTTATSHTTSSTLVGLSYSSAKQIVAACVALFLQTVVRPSLGTSGSAVGAAYTNLKAAQAAVGAAPSITSN